MTDHTAKLLHILRSLSGWSTQAMIAAKLGQERLEGHDIVTLNILVERGLVEVRRAHPVEYRYIDLDDEADTRPVEAAE